MLKPHQSRNLGVICGSDLVSALSRVVWLSCGVGNRSSWRAGTWIDMIQANRNLETMHWVPKTGMQIMIYCLLNMYSVSRAQEVIYCISYFDKTPWATQLRGRVYLGLRFQRAKSPLWQNRGMARSHRHGGRSRELSAHMVNCKHKAGRGN